MSQTVQIERRTFQFTAEVRAGEEGDGRRIVGHASVFDAEYPIGDPRSYGFIEVVRPGAFARAIREAQDVPALFNHEAGHLLARSGSGTLRLAEDATGLRIEADVAETSVGNDVLHLIQRGDLSQMSFAFRPAVGGDRWTTREDDGVIVEVRELLDLDLFDVSVVTRAANPATDVSKRSSEARERARSERAAAWAARKEIEGLAPGMPRV
jgi:HK97 family phage prohead protease